jgi:hypothetical protein
MDDDECFMVIMVIFGIAACICISLIGISVYDCWFNTNITTKEMKISATNYDYEIMDDCMNVYNAGSSSVSLQANYVAIHNLSAKVDIRHPIRPWVKDDIVKITPIGDTIPASCGVK